MQGTDKKSELIKVLGDVKARVQDKLQIAEFPMPQFILIGKQSVGKSRLIETLAGETFNFISGTLGSRRPTVLEFRNDVSLLGSKWFVRDRSTSQWNEHQVQQVMKIIGDSHEELGETVSPEPVYVRIESPNCVDMQIVDLPGFRDFAMDENKKELGKRIEELVETFMRDRRNVMLCVEQAGDAATMSTLRRCKDLDPDFSRTVLIRNKLDKYYADLSPESVEQWMKGFGDLPENLMKSAYTMTLPWWKDGAPPPKPFYQITADKNSEDVQTLRGKGLSSEALKHVGFDNFVKFMDEKVEQMFTDALVPIMTELQNLETQIRKREVDLKVEIEGSHQGSMLAVVHDCGASFAKALNHVMEGVIGARKGLMTLEDELKAFHAHHESLSSNHFMMLPSDDFSCLQDYIDYLRDCELIQTFDVPLSGGAQFRRLMFEVEIFLRFSEVAADTKKNDVIQARGVSMQSLTWREVIIKLLSAEAQVPLKRRVHYVGERLTWFFETQKQVVLHWMASLKDAPQVASNYSYLLVKHVVLMQNNSMMQMLIFEAYDQSVRRQLKLFVEMFHRMLASIFANPFAFLKGGTGSQELDDSSEGEEGEEGEAAVETPTSREAAAGTPKSRSNPTPMAKEPKPKKEPMPKDPEERVPRELQSRSNMESLVNLWLQHIPTEAHQMDEAVDEVQKLVLKIYALIRAQVCDQLELLAESFFKVPMLRQLESDMSNIELSEENKKSYEARRDKLQKEVGKAQEDLVEVRQCIDQLDDFKIRCETRAL